VYGASYGGYAALWGLVKTPQLYRCGVSFAGVTDLELMFKDASDRNASKVVTELMRARVGDTIVNKQQFDAVSPLRHAARITAPVLLMHGELDRRVPIIHGTKFRQALKDNGKQVEWLTFADEGHTIAQTANQRLYFKTLLQFLDKHIGPGASPAPASAPAPAPLR
jgi:dipeptidyl aminopeptidase/acylaminoacyl peptidase